MATSLPGAKVRLYQVTPWLTRNVAAEPLADGSIIAAASGPASQMIEGVAFEAGDWKGAAADKLHGKEPTQLSSQATPSGASSEIWNAHGASTWCEIVSGRGLGSLIDSLEGARWVC